MSRHARLYTEMVTADAVIHGDRERLIGFDPVEHPLALQLGGSEPEKLRQAARIGADAGFDEVNLNVGCPSDRVQSGAFGACLMKTPDLVAECVAAMRVVVDIPVTVKCRIGVDDQDPKESLYTLVEKSASAGCDVFIVHARKAWLQGLSPKENREVPPLDYPLVAQLKRDFPDLTIVLNGGITTIEACKEHLNIFDGVMLGRAAYGEPYILSAVDGDLFGDGAAVLPREEVALGMVSYIARLAAQGGKPHHATRHMLGLFHGAPGARTWRRVLCADGASAGPDAIERALEVMRTGIVAAAE